MKPLKRASWLRLGSRGAPVGDVLLFLWGWPTFKSMLNGGDTKSIRTVAALSKESFEIPGLDHKSLYRAGPVAGVPRKVSRAPTVDTEKPVYEFQWMSDDLATGIFSGAVV